MRFILLFLIVSIGGGPTYAQFPPPAGQPGTTAIFADSSIFVAWATGCIVERGLQDIADSTLGFASVGDPALALGKAGENGVVSLGDGGHAILTFSQVISNGQGWDFAVFENSFSDDFLELAFVEVSSNGVDFYRFPATSLTQDTLQLGAFGSIDATKIDNLAGKYRALYGTPFDLEELSGEVGLDINAVTHIKIIDVVGSIQDTFATYDQLDNKVNDPWKTPFESGGFDLDAVGIIVQDPVSIDEPLLVDHLQVYPNPAMDRVNLRLPSDLEFQTLSLSNSIGQSFPVEYFLSSGDHIVFEVDQLPPGLYFLRVHTSKGNVTQRLIIQHE